MSSAAIALLRVFRRSNVNNCIGLSFHLPETWPRLRRFARRFKTMAVSEGIFKASRADQ
jgi:hypothetical protein